MKSIIKIILTVILIVSFFNSKAQSFNQKNFDSKLGLSEILLTKQPTRDALSKILPKEFKIDSLQKFKYFLKDSIGNAITVYLHIETLKIVYIEFFEKPLSHKDLYAYLQQIKYEWIGSEHNCDYLNNKKISIVICPGMEKGMMVNISKYDL